MNHHPIPQLRDQGAAVLLLAHLHKTMGHLPAAHFQLDPHAPEQLQLSIHRNLPGFEIWREALGLGRPTTAHYTTTSCLAVEGVVSDVPLRLVGFASAADVNAFMAALHLAVAA